MAGTIPDPYKDLFTKRAFANLATLMKDGSPQVTPVWCDYNGSQIWINSAKGRLKDKNLRRDKRVALSIQDPDTPTVILPSRVSSRKLVRAAPISTSMPWRKNIWAKIAILIARRAESASSTKSALRRVRLTGDNL